jgi:ATP-dependent Clp protease ATP-binding subunit ClpA
VLLLDEIEKAHRDLFDILLQVMDHATLTDNHGREADFRHVVLIMTSNAGARDQAKAAIGFSGAKKSGMPEVERLFSPEFRNRLDEIVTFAPLTPEVMGRVVDKFVTQVQARLKERKVELDLTPAARGWLAEKGYDPDFGARPMARTIQTELEDKLSDELLFGRLARGGKVTADLGGGALVFRFADAPVPAPA